MGTPLYQHYQWGCGDRDLSHEQDCHQWKTKVLAHWVLLGDRNRPWIWEEVLDKVWIDLLTLEGTLMNACQHLHKDPHLPCPFPYRASLNA